MKNVLKISVFAFGLFSSATVNAQESVNSSGGNAAGSGGSVSYSIGQVVFTSHNGSGGSIAQGVQHAYDVLPVGVQKENELTFSFFPNPSSDQLTLEVQNPSAEQMEFRLYDLHGKLLNKVGVISGRNAIDMRTYPVAQYVGELWGKNNLVKSFQIIKN